MAPINIPAIEQHARALRAAEMRRLEDVFLAQFILCAGLAGGSVRAAFRLVGDTLRPLLSWKPHRHC